MTQVGKPTKRRATGPAKGRRWPRRVGFGLRERRSIGLFGGSFDPVHSGHLHVAQTALERLRLGRLIFIPARGNPLKQSPSAFADRIAAITSRVSGPRRGVSALEDCLGLSYTIDWMRQLMARRPTTRFVLVLGSDNWSRFHHWRDWKALAGHLPIAIIARPGIDGKVSALARARLSKSGRVLAQHRLAGDQAILLARSVAPRWVWLSAPLNTASSTAIRAGRKDIAAAAAGVETAAKPCY